MKTALVQVFRSFTVALLITGAFLGLTPAARAGLTFELHLVRFEHGQYYKFFTPLYTNATTADQQGTYFISSPLYSDLETTNGSWRELQVTTNGVNTLDGIENPYPDFDSMMQQITNGLWTMVFTNDTTNVTYTFAVVASGITSNMLPATAITYPGNDELNIPNQTTFTWEGPTNWPVINNTYLDNWDFSFFQYADLSATQESWTTPVMPNGVDCTFELQYITNNSTPLFTISTPLTTNSQPVSGWNPTTVLETGDNVSFAVTNPPVNNPILIAHYPFNSSDPGLDTSGNGYNLDFNGGNEVTSTNDAETGGGAAYFDGSSYLTYNSPPTNVLNTLAGDFSLSFWIKTTQNDGNENGPAWAGAGIVTADIPGGYNDLVPAALDGGEIGFNTGGYYGDYTVNSYTDINDGNYHHVVVTRNEESGEKDIYIDGVLDNSQFASQNPLSDIRAMAVGCAIDASQSDPTNQNPNNYFQGELDDLQLYAGILSSNQVSSLFSNPGSTIGSGSNNLIGGHTNVVYYSFEDDNLFAHDFSGHGNDIGGYAWFALPPYMTNDALAGTWAVGYTDSGWQSPPTNLVATLAGSFTVSLWAKTSDDPGNDTDTADAGAGLLSANSDQVIPLAQTGSKLAFLTGGNTPDTLHSATTINTGNYVHLVVTRDQRTGQKKIYINGNLDADDVGAPGTLTTASAPTLFLGMNSTLSHGFLGEMDEVQIYSGVLSSDEVLQLYNHPGTVIPDVAASSPNGGVAAHYDFDEGTALAPDVSGNGNNMVYAGNFGGSGPAISSDAVAGPGSVSFDGGSFLTASSNLLSTLADSFSVSLWVKTTQSSVADPGFFDAVGIVSADIPGGYNDLIPIGMDQYGEIVFNTGNTAQGYDDEMTSSATVNDGSWHHIVVTRDQTTGNKNIYIDGTLDSNSPGEGTTDSLSDPVLLTIGAIADASNPDPSSPSYTSLNGYDGLIDDIQIYDRVLSSNDVAFLYGHPGQEIGGSDANNVTLSLLVNITKDIDPSYGNVYFCFPEFTTVSPTPSTVDEVVSPNGVFSGELGSAGSYFENSLGDVLNECTNGLWTIYINRGGPGEQRFTFSMSFPGLTDDSLPGINILSPTNGSTGVSSTPSYEWSGPVGFGGIFAQIDYTNTAIDSTNLPGTATSLVFTDILHPGTNQFYLNYFSNNIPNVTFTTPVDSYSNALFSWSAQANLNSEASSYFVVSIGALPVAILSPEENSTNFLFSFSSQNGFMHAVQYRTNLVTGNWQTYTNVAGDGTLKTIPVPLSLFSPSRQGFIRVSTQ